MNTFGEKLRLTTFGESHGVALGGVLDGIPAGLSIDEEFISQQMQKRQGGRNRYATQRKEPDKVELLSGIFEGKTTGTPIGILIHNTNQKSKDYESIKDLFRPGHADFGYFFKYGLRDYRGGGRASARETSIRVAAGAIAQLLLAQFHISIQSGILSIGDLQAKEIDFSHAKESEIFALDPLLEEEQKALVSQARKEHNSIGGCVLLQTSKLPKGLGEPLYYKLDGAIGAAMMGLNGVKAVEIGSGIQASQMQGSAHNDPITPLGFGSNHSGGILGGMSNGESLVIKIHFKPTPSILLPQQSINTQNQSLTCSIKGRHDPCIAIRGSVVCQAQLALILADMLLLNATSKLEYLQTIYK